MRRAAARGRTAGLALALLLGLAPAAGRAEPESGAADAEALVRAVWYEGLPPERARALDAVGIARLAALLEDPDEGAVHANAVLALGLSGHPDAFVPLAAFAADAPVGEIGRDAYRARTWLPLAMGHLAARDARALAWLLAEAARPARPAWHFRHQHGAALAQLLEAQHLDALAWSGAPQAGALLERMAAQARQTGDTLRRDRAERALERFERVRRDGAAAQLRAERAGRGRIE